MIRPQGSLLRSQLDTSTSTKAVAAWTENWHLWNSQNCSLIERTKGRSSESIHMYFLLILIIHKVLYSLILSIYICIKAGPLTIYTYDSNAKFLQWPRTYSSSAQGYWLSLLNFAINFYALSLESRARKVEGPQLWKVNFCWKICYCKVLHAGKCNRIALYLLACI